MKRCVIIVQYIQPPNNAYILLKISNFLGITFTMSCQHFPTVCIIFFFFCFHKRVYFLSVCIYDGKSEVFEKIQKVVIFGQFLLILLFYLHKLFFIHSEVEY